MRVLMVLIIIWGVSDKVNLALEHYVLTPLGTVIVRSSSNATNFTFYGKSGIFTVH